MGYAEKMEECRRYIDAHLGAELSAVELAGHFHYSYYHFCRIFQSCNGMSVATYIRDQRLKMAIRKVEAGAGILEAALEVGFETPGGFTKAFKRQYGCTPTEYFKRKASEKEEEKMRQPQFVTLGPIYVMGHGRSSDKKSMDETQDGAYWYVDSQKSHGHGHMKEDTVKIGMWLKEPDENGNLIYFFGWKVDGETPEAHGLRTVMIPAAQYAVFTTEPLELSEHQGHKAFAERIQDTWKYIYGTWMDANGYELDENGYDFEYYDIRCADQQASCMDIYIPVKKINQA